MSIKAIYEIILHIDSFHNIDLYHFGLYCLKARFFSYDDKGKRIYNVIPYNITDIKQSNNSFDCLNQSSFNVEDFSFISKITILKFNKEYYKIDDVFHFKMEIEAFPEILFQDVFLECELMHSPISVNNYEEDKNEVWEQIGDNRFKSVSKFQGKIIKINENIKEFFHINFDENHFCRYNAVIRCFLLNIQYKKSYLPINNNLNNKELRLKNTKNLQEFLESILELYEFNNFDHFYFEYIERMKKQYELLKDELEYFSKNEKRSSIYKNLQSIKQSDSFLQQLLKSNEVKNFKPEDAKGIFISVFIDTFLKESNELAGIIFQLVQKYLEILKLKSTEIYSDLRNYYYLNIKDHFGESILRNIQKNKEDLALMEEKKGEENQRIAQKIRKQQSYQLSNFLKIEDCYFGAVNSGNPIIFEEVYQHLEYIDKESPIIKLHNNKKKHLFILVHGFRGNQYDMRLLQSIMKTKYPNLLFLKSSINEDNTDGNIATMGINLAKEIESFIEENNDTIEKISFVGHSLGGVIVRTSLGYLEKYKNRFFTFITFCSPHLGYLYSSSNLIDAGIWFMKKFMKVESLKQLSLKDNKNLRETFLYKLTQNKGLEWFENIALFSSYQDEYVPYESARIQKSKEALKDEKKGHIYKEMADNIFKNLKNKKITRIDVNFNILEKNLDRYLGRTAHINFISSQYLLEMIVSSFPVLFS